MLQGIRHRAARHGSHARSARMAWAGMKGAGLALALGCASASAQQARVLNFWGVGGFTHGSRIAANALLDSLSKAMDFQLESTDNASVMTAANLARFDVVVLNNVTEIGKLFNADQRSALLAFMTKRGMVGWHGSGDSKGSWPEYLAFLGAELSSPGTGIATLNRDTGAYAVNTPLLAGIPASATFDEEWYAYKTNPRLAPGVRVLYLLDETSCASCTRMKGEHPVIWAREDPGGGRTYYQAMGHGDSMFRKNVFSKALIAQALSWTSKCAIRSSACASARVARRGWLPPEGLGVKAIGNGLSVSAGASGAHRIEVFGMGGRRLASAQGSGSRTYTFANLPVGEYAVVMTAADGRRRAIAAIR
jgi:type 1 glutamine amidotransferase